MAAIMMHQPPIFST